MSSQKDAWLHARCRVGFNGQPHELPASTQLLGTGYRAYSPELMRFQRPDALSPFGDGGVNTYAYCGNEPLMRTDPNGTAFSLLAAMLLPAVVGGPAAFLASHIDDTSAKVGLSLVAAGAFALSAVVAGTVGTAAYKVVAARMQERRLAGPRSLSPRQNVRQHAQAIVERRQRQAELKRPPPSYELLRKHNFDPDGAPPTYKQAKTLLRAGMVGSRVKGGTPGALPSRSGRLPVEVSNIRGYGLLGRQPL